MKPTKSIHAVREIIIQLDSYEDIFSDFDPSPYQERLISDDFIVQAKKFSESIGGFKMTIKLLVPAKNRNEAEEKLIVIRLHEYFSNVRELLYKEIKKTNLQGGALALSGLISMVIASYLSFIKPEPDYVHILKVIFEPAGWFLLWTGLDHLVYQSKKRKKEIGFYRKMVNAQIKFIGN